ncbi:nucleotidyl transferase AbiEii/AbiGii toxin family protein [Candidatus Pantoea formicae]|uniref:Nucleotidyl transferase AbiEii/AbiGii toxin family protein n=1 Tax=Candidatus Pantoea formicae TaxID=2608355 RepID=A0ABX0QTF4_9GAMM|nr:nucleotidyl transferase AbiEii/AbiGii toxin family protein [Pantoea formicae]MDF7649618.1 nucleotidyl transferase AbiEii/AbiGii toxin family protein [Erwiniaceae bacterium L1_54_3]NIF00332.1 nucleotidyl transferase AbiEii/AbiGii toxin family protein [Pantoea formicae]
MDRQSVYYKQVQLLLQILPIVSQHNCFALKGGTAINLFIRDLPRLSVDIDLVFLPVMDRQQSLMTIRLKLNEITNSIIATLAGSTVIKSYEDKIDALRLTVVRSGIQIKIELSPVLRGTVYEPSVISVSDSVEEEFGFAETLVVAFADLYAGKICAALDRQHPRDLFDIKFLLDNEGLTEELRKALLVYLVSHPRPLSELLRPQLKDIGSVYEGEFRNMAEIDVSREELEAARTQLIETINRSITEQERHFLLTFKYGTPDWALLGLTDVEQLPAVRWKLHNLSNMQPSKHTEALAKLKDVLLITS